MSEKSIKELVDNAKISARIIAEVGKGKGIKEAMDEVLFEGAYDTLIDELYTEMSNEL